MKTKELVFHYGGIVGGRCTRTGEEIVAVVKTGELVLNQQQQENLAKLLTGPNRALISVLGLHTMKPANVAEVGNTFAPHVEVSVNTMPGTSGADACRCGEIAADALDCFMMRSSAGQINLAEN